MAVVILPVIILAPFLPYLIKWFGKKKLTVVCSIATILLSIIQYKSGYENFILFLVIAAIRVAFMQIPLMLYGMFTSDCIEYGASKNGERTEGMAFSLQTFVTKLSAALCNTICLLLLGFYGYVQKAPRQTNSTLEGIWIIMSLVPIIGYVIMIFIMHFYNLDEASVARMAEQNRTKIQN
jgi:probable glucitol transport protein GutA